MKKEEREKIINEYNKNNEPYQFDINNFNKESMIEYANNIIIEKMINEKELYSRTKRNHDDSIDSVLPAPMLIVDRTAFMTLEEIGQVYLKIDEEFRREGIEKYNYNAYQLQQNFIAAILYRMSKNNMIDKEENVTKKLKIDICEKYLKSSYIEDTEEKETAKTK